MSEVKIVFCNQCEKILKQENGLLKEDAFEARKEWGYFSGKDLEVHQFVLCEECYDRMIKRFKIPVRAAEKREVFSEYQS